MDGRTYVQLLSMFITPYNVGFPLPAQVQLQEATVVRQIHKAFGAWASLPTGNYGTIQVSSSKSLVLGSLSLQTGWMMLVNWGEMTSMWAGLGWLLHRLLIVCIFFQRSVCCKVLKGVKWQLFIVNTCQVYLNCALHFYEVMQNSTIGSVLMPMRGRRIECSPGQC